VALTDDGDVWWEGLTEEPPAHLIDWKGRDWTPGSAEPAAHPNARFTTPADQCPTIAPTWDDPAGVPISAILFGGRRASTVPLVIESFDWDHGVFLGANVASEKTAAAEGTVGELRHDPFAMLPFCGYNMGDYFGHWLSVGQKAEPEKLPRLFYVNWFRKDAAGRFVWPGFGENSRVLKWIVERVSALEAGTEGAVSEGAVSEGAVSEGAVSEGAVSTPVGLLPAPGALDLDGLDLSQADLDLLLTVDVAAWRREAEQMPEFFRGFGGHLPARLWELHEELAARLG
jgi:phosphoenolpyruvate carboxykinase (GTP)